MTFDEQASKARREADHDAIARLLAQYPWGNDVPPRSAGSVRDCHADIERLPVDSKKRATKLRQQIESWQGQLLRSIGKHDSLKRNGLQDVGDYDLVVCYSGDSLKACKFTMDLHEAHISYDLSILEILDRELSKLDGSVPPGFCLVDAVLLPHQAYQVRKWAEIAEARLNQARTRARMNARTEQRESE